MCRSWVGTSEVLVGPFLRILPPGFFRQILLRSSWPILGNLCSHLPILPWIFKGAYRDSPNAFTGFVTWFEGKSSMQTRYPIISHWTPEVCSGPFRLMSGASCLMLNGRHGPSSYGVDNTDSSLELYYRTNPLVCCPQGSNKVNGQSSNPAISNHTSYRSFDPGFRIPRCPTMTYLPNSL